MVSSLPDFKKIVDHYKSQNYKIAVDDAGAGYSGLNLISVISPHYIKIDMDLIRDIDKDNLKYAVVKGLVELSHLSNIKLIAEGIETREELETLINMGVSYGQGYIIQKPEENFLPILDDVKDIIREINQKRNHTIGSRLDSIYIENITSTSHTVGKHTRVSEVFELFKKNDTLSAVCITEHNNVLGIITRSRLTSRLSEQYGYSLYNNKAIITVMESDYLEADHKTPISVVSNIAMARSSNKLYDPIIVTKHEKYAGVVTVKDLLERTTQIEIFNAKNLNPLTGLPGNKIIENTLMKCVDGKAPFSALYIDINNFKSYNDVYGFENGDLIIKLVASIVLEAVGQEDFVGHIGGDDFVAIVHSYEYKEIAEQILEKFKKRSLDYYNKADIENGFIITENRKGAIEKFPLASLSIAVVTNQKKNYRDIYEVSGELAELKHKCKKKNCNCYMS